MAEDRTYDVVILGSGLASATLATILVRQGLSVVMLEAGSHPRFAIGESVVPEFGALTRVLAARYDVPELEHLSTFQGIRHHVSASCGKKRNFTFLHHTEDAEPHGPDWSQFQTMTHPLGPDSHLYRPDVDAWLTVLAVGYGADYREREPITDPDAIDLTGDGVTVRTAKGTYRGRFLVDGTGFRSVLAKKLGLRAETDLATDSRTIFTHMVGVRPLETVLEGAPCPVPSPPDQGTLHHVFDGGWFWIIPFDNHSLAVNRVCSVGLTLDRRQHPDSDLDPEAELRAFADRFPVVRRQLAGARAVRSWVKTSRIQYRTEQLAGPRWCLLPHSAAFLDPLYSNGLVLTLHGVREVADALLLELRDGSPAAERFSAYQANADANLRALDRIIHGSYLAFRSPELFGAWYRIWAVGSFLGSAATIALHMRFLQDHAPAVFDAMDSVPYRRSLGTDDPRYLALLDEGYALMRQVEAGELSVKDATGDLYSLLDRQRWIPPQFHIADRHRRHLASFTVFPLLALISWGKRNAPLDQREVYYGVGPVFFRELVRSLFAEARRGLLSFLKVFRAAHWARGRA